MSYNLAHVHPKNRPAVRRAAPNGVTPPYPPFRKAPPNVGKEWQSMLRRAMMLKRGKPGATLKKRSQRL
jgi:hypothetical protein